MKYFTNLSVWTFVAFLAILPGKANSADFSVADLNNASSGTTTHPEGDLAPSNAQSGNGMDYYWGLGPNSYGIDVVVSLDHFSGNSFSFNGYVSNDGSSWQMVSPNGELFNTSDEDDKGIRFNFGGNMHQYFGVTSNNMVLTDTGSGADAAEFDGLSAVPEPSAAMLFGMSLIGFAVYRKQSNKQSAL